MYRIGEGRGDEKNIPLFGPGSESQVGREKKRGEGITWYEQENEIKQQKVYETFTGGKRVEKKVANKDGKNPPQQAGPERRAFRNA